jgi:hypothetical protein
VASILANPLTISGVGPYDHQTGDQVRVYNQRNPRIGHYSNQSEINVSAGLAVRIGAGSWPAVSPAASRRRDDVYFLSQVLPDWNDDECRPS